MSDTDDGFDEEAVRRELREKYEDDDREETERMSELLLQGATMTNQHCDHCGTPIFRYDGQAFCPNCQHDAEQAADQQARAQGGEQPQRDQQAQSGGQAADQQARAQGGEQPQRGQQARRDEQPQEPQQRQPDQQPEATRQAPEQHREQPQTGQRRARAQQSATSSEAADALESSISALARRAAGSDDPRRAREYLEAAREAAEALAALRHDG